MTLHVGHDHHGEDEPDSHDQCLVALSRIQEFLHGELDETAADVIREHLAACESCLDTFDVEVAIASLVRRSVQAPACPWTLRARVMRLSITVTTTDL